MSESEFREFAERIPEPAQPEPPNNVIPFPSRAERWSRQWTRPLDFPPQGPSAA